MGASILSACDFCGLGMTGVINGLILATTGGHPEGTVAPL
jgi:hypothetical protein